MSSASGGTPVISPNATIKAGANAPEGFSVERAERYARATSAAPAAREGERVAVRAALDRLSLGSHHKIVEMGVGQGFGTATLLTYLAPEGQLIGVDASAFMMRNIGVHPQTLLHVGALDDLQIQADSVDLAFCLAAFHHIPNKFLVMQELARILAPGACFVIVDVTHGTPAQETFDYLVRPYCTTGHDADFLDQCWAELLADRTGFVLESLDIAPMDWLFDNEAIMLQYVCDLFCLDMTPDAAAAHIRKWLKPYLRADGTWVLPWSMGIYVMRKSGLA